MSVVDDNENAVDPPVESPVESGAEEPAGTAPNAVTDFQQSAKNEKKLFREHLHLNSLSGSEFFGQIMNLFMALISGLTKGNFERFEFLKMAYGFGEAPDGSMYNEKWEKQPGYAAANKAVDGMNNIANNAKTAYATNDQKQIEHFQRLGKTFNKLLGGNRDEQTFIAVLQAAQAHGGNPRILGAFAYLEATYGHHRNTYSANGFASSSAQGIMQQTRPYAEDVLINFGHRVSDPGVRALHNKLLPELKNGEAFDPSDRSRKYANIYYSANAGRWRVKDSAGNLKNEVLALRHDDQTTSELTELENQRVMKYAENQAKNTPIPTRAASYDYETRVATHLYMDHNVGRGAHHLIMDTVRNNPNAIMANVLSNNGMHLHHKNNPGYFYRNGMPLTAQQVYDRYLQKIQEGLDYHDRVEISLQDKNDKIAQDEKKDSGSPEAEKTDTKDEAITTADATDKLKDAFPDAASGQTQEQEEPIAVASVALRGVPIPGIKPNS